LFAIPARQLSSHKCVAKETQGEKNNDENEDQEAELYEQDYDADQGRDDKYQKIRDDIFPCDLFLAKPFRHSFGKQQTAQPSFAESTGLPVIITVHAMPGKQPEFKEEDEEDIQYEPDGTELVHEKCANTIH